VTLLHRLEENRWVARMSAAHDRRCKTVHLAPRAERVIEQINSAAFKLRHELLDEIPAAELRICMRVLDRIMKKAENLNGNGRRMPVRAARNGQN
jgi:DNA-binding MarR family transcriptional regulator